MDVILHLTHDCQLDCSYCYGGHKDQRAMSWDVAARAIDLLVNQPTGDPPPQLAFFGGEPLLQPALLRRCVAYAEDKLAQRDKPFRLAITTNGLGLDDEMASYLQTHRILPTLSFDGVQAAQDACRRYAGGTSSFADTMAAMQILRKYFPDLPVCAVVTPANVAHLPASIDFLLDAGIRRLFLNPDFFGTWNESSRALWRKGYEHAARRFGEACRRGEILHVNFITAKIVTHLKGGYEPCDCCDFGQKEIAVAPSGNIYPCQRMVGEDREALGLMGNVLTGLNPKRCAELATCREVRSPECQGCALRRRCRNWCSCVNHRLTGRFDQAATIVCFHEQMAIEIADRVASALFADRVSTFMETFYFERQVQPEWI